MGSPRHEEGAAELFARYRPLPGVPDELCDASGAMRPAWAGLIAQLSSQERARTEQDFARGRQYLSEAGVFFREYGDPDAGARDWPFSPVPVILHESEWRSIEAGLIQRADLLEAVAADLYGPRRLAAEGHLPAGLIARSPEWLRPMAGVIPRSGHFLHFAAFEIGRGPDGRWWVLSDRTNAPSGAGFALENRVAASRVFPGLFAKSNVHRLAGFFGAFRDALDELGQGDAAAILTPGPYTDTYYEQAYIARYMGLPLLEGGDLTVRNGQVMIRTVQGLVPAGVLWRRMDAGWTDPLEFRETSRIGTPGLMSSVRQGRLTMVNALGAGVLETQALMAFLPAISERLTGAPLAMPNVATWWCGQEAELDHVRRNAGQMMIGPALATRMAFETDSPHAAAGELRNVGSGSLEDWLEGNAPGLVGQELVTLSTTPVWQDGALVPRPMSLRVFLARTPTGWQAMPGGFARIGAAGGGTGGRGGAGGTLAMQDGGSVADVWVVSDSPVDEMSLLNRSASAYMRPQPGPLPSRAADNLFWLGRYVERTEGLIRLARSLQSRRGEAAEPLLALIRASMTSRGAGEGDPLPEGLAGAMDAAVGSAAQIRDRFSVDGWTALEDLQKTMKRMALTMQPGSDAAQAFSVLLRKIAGFSGLVHENMHRSAAWQFLTMGRSLERAAAMSGLLARVTVEGAPQGALDLAIEIGDSVMIHRQRFAVTTRPESVVDLLALDAANPRSVLFNLAELREQIESLPDGRPRDQMTEVKRRIIATQTALSLHSVQSLDAAALDEIRLETLALSDALTQAYF